MRCPIHWILFVYSTPCLHINITPFHLSGGGIYYQQLTTDSQVKSSWGGLTDQVDFRWLLNRYFWWYCTWLLSNLLVISAAPCWGSPQWNDPHGWFGTSFPLDVFPDATLLLCSTLYLKQSFGKRYRHFVSKGIQKKYLFILRWATAHEDKQKLNQSNNTYLFLIYYILHFTLSLT